MDKSVSTRVGVVLNLKQGVNVDISAYDDRRRVKERVTFASSQPPQQRSQQKLVLFKLEKEE
jgi:hypothetical protein